jgi:stage II sporulation protein D
MHIGVFRDYSIKKIVFAYTDGSFGVYGDTTYYGTVLPNEFVELSFESQGKVIVSLNSKIMGTEKKVRLIPNSLNSSIVYSPKNCSAKERKYKDEVEVTTGNKDLTIVNLVDMNHYLSGVVESEGGGGKEIEYYKVQSIISRTYALKNQEKHQSEGFQLCDRTHCQAYLYQNRFTPLIDSAVLYTNNEILVDANNNLVDTYFHANCGGQTSEPDYVWNSKIPYLKSFKDTFCIYTKQATWEKTIPKSEWSNFLIKEYHFPENDSIEEFNAYTFVQNDRMAFYISPALGIPLRDIRDHFKLKSTYFSAHSEGENIILQGRGYGHGVGLCQEGAMKMAKYKYTDVQILMYYYNGARITQIKKIIPSLPNNNNVKLE